MAKRVIIIGGGVCGLAAAVRLAASKLQPRVLLLEESDHLGGHLQAIRIPHPMRPEAAPFVFDVDPSPLTMPYAVLDLFAVAEQDVRDHLKIVKIDPLKRYSWQDGTSFDRWADEPELFKSIATISKDDLAGWMKLLAAGRRESETTERRSEADVLPGWRNILRYFQQSGTFLRQAIQPSAADRVNRGLVSSKLRQVWHFEMADDTATMRPDATPLAMRWIEHEYGAWHIEGGMHRLVERLETLARNLGVEIRCNCPIERMIKSDAPQHLANPGSARGVRLRDGTEIFADLVFLSTHSEDRQSRSTLLLGVETELQIVHRTTLFMDATPTSGHVEVACPSRTDPTLAPLGCHALIVRGEGRWDTGAVIQSLERRLGLSELTRRIVVQQMIPPGKLLRADGGPRLAEQMLRGKALSDSAKPFLA